ncbi:hypothetical protein LCGC14_2048000, partial [marine sediment metagenome]
MMAEGNARYKGWSTDRKYKAALSKILDDGWTVSETARMYGLARSHLSTRVKKARDAREVRVAEALTAVAAAAPTLVDVEDRLPFGEWFERYFGTWICPDCLVHHALPPFHLEIVDSLRSSERRTLVN